MEEGERIRYEGRQLDDDDDDNNDRKSEGKKKVKRHEKT